MIDGFELVTGTRTTTTDRLVVLSRDYRNTIVVTETELYLYSSAGGARTASHHAMATLLPLAPGVETRTEDIS
jgi:hypothetical protein